MIVELFLLVLSGFMFEVINSFHEQSDAVKSAVTVLKKQTARDKANSRDKGVMFHQCFNEDITYSEDRGTTISASVSYVFRHSAYAVLHEQTMISETTSVKVSNCCNGKFWQH